MDPTLGSLSGSLAALAAEEAAEWSEVELPKMASPSYSPSASSGTTRRRTTPAEEEDQIHSIASDRTHQAAGGAGGLVEPAPNPRPIFQFLACGLIIFLGLLQFLLSPTHFRDPSDPFRNWLPFHQPNYSSSSSSSELETARRSNSGFSGGSRADDGMVHIVSWMDCLDLRVLAVLANSTLSNSRYPNLVFFHFFIPGGKEDKISFYKLKVLFPHSNLEIHGQEKVKEVMKMASSGLEGAGASFDELLPLIISSVHQFSGKFIYISPNVIMKGRVEELIGTDLNNYAFAAAEDCSERLNTYVNSEVLDVVQRSASEAWVSQTPYVKEACLPDLNLLLVDPRKIERDILEAVLWWIKVLNLRERPGKMNPAVALALYSRYLVLSSSWLVKDSTLPEIANSNKVIQYDGPQNVCSQFGSSTFSSTANGNGWTRYLSSNSVQILNS